jgi:hypothetical protein
MGSGGKGEVAFGEFGGASGEDGAEYVDRMAGQESLERLVEFALDAEKIE